MSNYHPIVIRSGNYEQHPELENKLSKRMKSDPIVFIRRIH